MANLIYSLYGDNLIAGVTATLATGTALSSALGVANLTDLNPARPLRTTGTTLRATWDLGSAKQVDWVPVINHNIDAGLANVLIQANTSNSFGSPPLSVPFTIPAVDLDGFHPNPWIDLTPFTRVYRFWSFVLLNANSVNLSIGEIALIGTKRSMPTNLQWTEIRTDTRPVTEFSTPKGVQFIYDSGVRTSDIKSSIDNSDANEITMRQWWLETRGRARPFFIVPDPAVNDCRLVRWSDSKRERSQILIDRNQVDLAFEELSRGIAF